MGSSFFAPFFSNPSKITIMKILGIYGSPRLKGNSAQLLDAVLAQAEKKGAQVVKHHLNSLSFRGCQACYSCRKEGNETKCAIKDDMNQILADVLASNAVVLASPVYMWQMTGQAKLFTDRLMPVLKPDYTSWLTGQKLLSIYTQGQPDISRFALYFDHVNQMFSFLGFQTLPPLVFGGLRNIDDIQNHPAAFEQVRRAVDGLTAD
jgi:multimeric flavodoxin WrbA